MDRTDEDRAAPAAPDGFEEVPDTGSLLTLVCRVCGALVPMGASARHRGWHQAARIGLP